jgi:hypothetical protein
MIDPIQFTRRYIDILYDRDELLALVLLDGEPSKKWGKTTIGFYRPDDRETLFEHVELLDKRGNLYVNLQRLSDDVYGRAAGRLKPWSKTRFTDAEIVSRPRACVDLDPIRVTGVNSTDAECQHAIDLAAEIRDYLVREFELNPVAVHSGNGVQLVARINEPRESDAIERLLKHLDQKFSNDKVKIDQSLGDLARMVRLPGTVNCKGDDIPERPRRYSHLLEVRNAI